MTMNDEGLLSLQSNIDRCTGCGLCASECSTFQASGWESESPRGRIQLAKGLVQGRLPLSSVALETFDRCLGCTKCQDVCPTSVDYSIVRGQVQRLRNLNGAQPAPSEWLKPLRRTASSRKRYWWKQSLRRRFLGGQTGSSVARPPTQAGEITLIPSCMQELLAPEQIHAALYCAEQLGIPLGLGNPVECCGAIFERLDSTVSDEQETYTESFLSSLAPAACLFDSPCHRQCKRAAPALHFDSLSTLLSSALGGECLTLSKSVMFMGACSEDAVLWERLLGKIQGLELEQYGSNACCGGFGLESLVDSKNAQSCLTPFAEEMEDELVIVTPSMDCWLQFRRSGYSCVHPVELIAEALNNS